MLKWPFITASADGFTVVKYVIIIIIIIIQIGKERNQTKPSDKNNPSRLDSGRKKGYMTVMKDLSETMGYYELGLSSQNLRDQAQRLEKMEDRKGEVVRNDIGLESTGNRMDRSESLLNSNSHDLEAEADLHMEDVTVKSNSVRKRPIAIDSSRGNITTE